MTTLTLSQGSLKWSKTALTDPHGSVTYEISTPFKFGGGTTTIKRNGRALATIKWNMFGGGRFTMGGISGSVSDVFPKTGMLSKTRVFTAANGEKLKWADKSKLYCISADTDTPLATYDRNEGHKNTMTTLEISPNGMHLMDFLVVSWVLAEKKAQDRRVKISSGVDGGAAVDGGGGC